MLDVESVAVQDVGFPVDVQLFCPLVVSRAGSGFDWAVNSARQSSSLAEAIPRSPTDDFERAIAACAAVADNWNPFWLTWIQVAQNAVLTVLNSEILLLGLVETHMAVNGSFSGGPQTFP